jgi:DNA-binding transcriptional LysR family regulator
LAEAEHAVSGDQETPCGDLTVSAPLGLGRTYLTPIVTEFLAQYPEVNVQISLSDRPVDLSGEHIDIALRVGDLADSDMIAVRVGEMGRVLCASPAYLRARGTPKSPDELTAHDCISYSTMQSPNTWTFTRDRTEYAVPVRSRLLVSNLESACDAARAGRGITIAHLYHAADDIKSGELKTRRWWRQRDEFCHSGMDDACPLRNGICRRFPKQGS